MKKTWIAVVLLLLLLPTMVFAGTRDIRDIYREVVGKEMPTGKHALLAAEEAGKGEEFYNAVQKARKAELQAKVKAGILTQAEADFLDKKMHHSYQDMKKLEEIRAKLWKAHAKSIPQKGIRQGRGKANFPIKGKPKALNPNPNNHSATTTAE